MTREENKISRVVLASVIFGVLGFGLGFFIHSFYVYMHCDTTGLQYINKNMLCKEQPAVRKHGYAGLKRDLEEFISSKKDTGSATEISIYFRDLQFGPTLGLDEHAVFAPASLLKLPLLLTYQNIKNDLQSDLFERKVKVVNARDTLTQMIRPEQQALPGEEYTVGKLLELMIIYSDNTAYYALLDYLAEIFPNEDPLQETLSDLGIVDPQDFLENTISVKSYGSIFTQLYNSSYFSSKEPSNEVLRLLTQTTWKNGLSRGVPADIEIAHKFGERSDFVNNVVQLHDCGIVYFPGNPYLLCVMTRGYDMTKLSEIIGTISKMFYDEMIYRKI